MTAATHKRFRIETFIDGGSSSEAGEERAEQRHAEILREIRSLQEELRPTAEARASAIEEIRAELSEAGKMKGELEAITRAIEETKQEIASLHQGQVHGMEMSQVTDQLDAIVLGTERATETILTHTETIDDLARDLAAKLKGGDQGLASDIQESVISIFEACNFQDLTGQRISKVIRVLKFIEERVERMIDIWGGVESFHGVDVTHHTPTDPDDELLSGPALDADANTVSQDEIDALFG